MNKNNLFNEDKPKKSLPCILPSSTEDKDKKIVAIPLESNHDFLELFSIKSKQCFHVNIPDVLLIDDESFQKTIIFNQITSKTLTIISKPIESSKNFLNNLRNKSNNTTLYNKKKPMMKFQQRILQALIRFTSFKPIAMIKLNNGKKFPITHGELDEYLKYKSASIRFIQEYINLPQKSTYSSYETFYCRYQFLEKTGLIIKKKSKTFSDPSLNNSSKHYIPLKYRDPKLKSAQEKFLYNNDLMGFMFYSTFYQAILDCGYNNETVLRKKPLEIADIKTHTNIYNSFDQAINNKMIQACHSLISFVTSRNMEVKKMTAKFLYHSEEQKIFFIGIKELIISPKAELAKYPGLNELKDMKMKELKNLDVPKQIKKNYISNISKTETKDTYSKKLATILKKEACSGDFCSHVFDNYEKGGIEELTSNLIDFKELSSIIHEDFHQYQYEISSNLITRARENCEKLPEIFRKYRITNKNPNSQNFKPLLIHKNEYKTVKVCKNCSLIYTVLLKEFKVNKLNKSQAQPKYLHSETYYKNSSKHHLKQYLHIDPPETKIHSIKNISFVNNSKTPIFSLQKEYFFPKSKESKSKIKQKQISQDNFLLKSFNLFKNTVQTRKGEVTLNSVFLEKSNDDIANTMLKSQVNRASLFGNPQKKSFLFAPEIIKYNFANTFSSKHTENNMNFQNSFDGNVLFPSPKNNSNSQIIKSTFQRNNIKHPSFIDRKIANLSSYQINKIFKRKKFMVFDGNRSIAHSIFHRTFDYLRKLPYFKMNTPRISLFDGKKALEQTELIQKINIKGVADLLEIECPTYKNLNIEVLVIDASTSITYSVLFSCKSLEVKNKEILIVCHDFFDNYLEKIEYYQELISDLQNYIIVLFNFPCQAYTLYTSEITYNNEYLSKCLDLLIYELVRRKLFHIRSDNLRFIGFGYGCNAILHFVSSAFSSINNIKACLLFNCFLYIDDQLKTFLENSIRLLSESEESEFSSLLFDCFGNKNIAWAQNKSEKKSNNPITNQGRIALLKGCLENYNIYKNVQAIENSCLVFVNSSHNSLVSNSQKNIILSQAPNVLKNLKNFYQKGKKFNLNIFDAGYNINNDKPEEIKIIIQDFLKSDIPLDIDQRIAFIDKLLLIVEEIMRKFYREEIENFNNFRDLADSYLSFDFEQFTEIEVDFSETINGLLDIKDRISDLNQKIKKASEFFAENRGEIQEEGDDLIGKIMNIQQKKLNEFSRYLLTIKNEIELPLKNYIFLLKGTFKFLQINEEFNIFKNDNATILETKLGQFAEILLMKQGENDELEKTLIKNIKMFSNFQIRVKKKYNKYLKNLEGLNQANQKFQKFIIIIMNRINPIFQILEEKILKNLEIFLVKYIEGVNFQENIFNCIKLIIDCYDNYYGIKLSNEINLMNMNKKPSSEKNSGGFENEIRQVIEKISKILPEKKSLD